MKKKIFISIIIIIAIVLIGIIFYPSVFSFFIKTSVNRYDYSNDIEQNGYISEKGAKKIAIEGVRGNIISIECTLKENQTNYTLPVGEKEVEPKTYWVVHYRIPWAHPILGPDRSIREILKYIDYHTGEILGEVSSM